MTSFLRAVMQELKLKIWRWRYLGSNYDVPKYGTWAWLPNTCLWHTALPKKLKKQVPATRS